MRVLMLGATLEGGVSNYISNITNNSDSITFLIPFVNIEEKVKLIELYGEKVEFVRYNQMYSYNVINRVYELKKLIGLYKINVIHAHVLRYGLIPVLMKFFLRDSIKIIYTGHGLRYTQKRSQLGKFVFRKIEILINYFSNKVVFIREFDYNVAINDNILSEEKASIIKTRIRLGNNSIQNNFSLRDEFSITTRKIVAMVGAIYDLKNPELFYEIASEYTQINEDVTFVWVGDGPSIEDFRVRVSVNDLNNNIKFVGKVEYNNMKSVWNEIDILLVTSKVEIMPLIVLEAFLSETIVISSNFSGVENVIKSNVDGFVFNIKNYQEAIELIDFVVKRDSKLNNRMIENALNKYLNDFSRPEIMAKKYAEKYCEL